MIYIVRHGQTDWNLERRLQGQKDIPLNETGRNEATICRNQLTSIKVDEIISSDLSRAKETAEIINKSRSLPIKYDSRLRELNCGNIEGKVIDTVPWHSFICNPNEFHSEPMIDLYNRLKSFFNEIDASKNTVTVTHTGVVKMLAYLVNNPQYNENIFEQKALQFKVKNGDIFMWDKKTKLQLLVNEALKKSNSLEY